MAQSCRVVGDLKALAQAGGVPALCQAIDRARAAKPGWPFSVTVTVALRGQFSSEIVLATGEHLPALETAEMDRALSPATFDRLGQAIVDYVTHAKQSGKSMHRG